MIGPLIIAVFVLLYAYVWKKFQYFKNLGILYEPGYFPFGSYSSWRAMAGQVPLFNICEEIYPKYPDAKVVGYYGFLGKPILVVRDLEVVKKVMIKDFSHFMNRTFDAEWVHPDANRHFANMLSVLEGPKWKAMRAMITPIFTSGKIKSTLPIVYEAAEEMSNYFGGIENEFVDAKDVYQMFTGEVLGKLGCGINPQVFSQPKDNVYYDQVIKLTGGGKPSVKQILQFMALLLFPRLSYYLKVSFLDEGASNFFDNIIRNSIRSRKGVATKKNDFVEFFKDALNDLDVNLFSKDGSLTEEQKEDLIISNAILLFFAGMDTSSSGLSVAAYFLAKNPDVQEKLYQEIQDAIEENNGSPNLDYNKLHGLKYLDSVLKESLRLWGLNFFDRTCTKDYFIEDVGMTVPVGMVVQIPGASIMMEDKYYNNPLQFNPDAHFSDDNSLYSSTFMVFGQGPRNCIGMRFAYTMMRAGLVHTMAKYKFLPNSKTINDWVIDPLSPSALPKGGINVKFEARK